MRERVHDLVRQLVAILHVHFRTIRRWIEDGKLPAVRMPSGRYRIRAGGADAMLRDT